MTATANTAITPANTVQAMQTAQTTELALPAGATQRDAVAIAAAELYRHYPGLVRSASADQLKSRNRMCLIALSEFAPEVIFLAALEWLCRANKYAPQPGEWRDYCQRIEYECCLAHGEDVDYGRRGGAGWAKQREQHDRAEWRKRLLPATRQYIAVRQAENQAKHAAEAHANTAERARQREQREQRVARRARDQASAIRARYFDNACTASDEQVLRWGRIAEGWANIRWADLRVVAWAQSESEDGANANIVTVQPAAGVTAKQAAEIVHRINANLASGSVVLQGVNA